VGPSTGVVEEPNAILVRSHVPRTGAAFARGAEVPRVRSRADYDGGERRGARLTRLLAGREGRCQPRRSRRRQTRTTRNSAGVRAVRRGGSGVRAQDGIAAPCDGSLARQGSQVD